MVEWDARASSCRKLEFDFVWRAGCPGNCSDPKDTGQHLQFWQSFVFSNPILVFTKVVCIHPVLGWNFISLGGKKYIATSPAGGLAPKCNGSNCAPTSITSSTNTDHGPNGCSCASKWTNIRRRLPNLARIVSQSWVCAKGFAFSKSTSLCVFQPIQMRSREHVSSLADKFPHL